MTDDLVLPEVQRSRSHTLGDLLRRSAARYPNKVALIDGELRWTYLELDAAVNCTANALRARGIDHGDRVAVLSHNCWQYAVLAFALAKIGAILVPINFMLGPEEVAHLLTDAGAAAMITEGALHPIAEQACCSAETDIRVRGWISLARDAVAEGWDDVGSWAVMGDATEPDIVVDDDDVLRLMYTSGTESAPKGVMLSSRSLIAQYVSCIVGGGMATDDIDVHSLPLYHCAQLDCFFGPDVYLGATSIILHSSDPATILRTIEAERATKFFAPPTVWISLLRSPLFDRTDLSSLLKGYYGASAMPVEVLLEIQHRLPRLRLWNFYGQTELASVATILQPEDQLTHPGSAGRPAINVETLVVDDKDQPLPSGDVGEIVHRSLQATLGYWNKADKTAEAFRNGWFHSGDLGMFTADGLLSVVDRKKDMIKTGGENVASREVEEVIYLHDAVAEVAAFGIRHPLWIEAVTAVVVLKPGRNLAAETLKDHCRAKLASFKVPKYVVFALALPKNPSGKLLKRELRNSYAHLSDRA